MVICLERGTDLRMAQLMPLPLTVSCFSKIQIGFTFLVPAHPGNPVRRAVKWLCVCVVVYLSSMDARLLFVLTFDGQPWLVFHADCPPLCKSKYRAGPSATFLAGVRCWLHLARLWY